MRGRWVGKVVTAALSVLAVTAAACSSSPMTTTATIPAPTGLPSFYSVPTTVPSSAPGTLVKSELIASDGIHGRVYRVLYVSESIYGKPTLVTGLVMVPETPAPAGGYPVVTWGHGTNGMADQCAPSFGSVPSGAPAEPVARPGVGGHRQ